MMRCPICRNTFPGDQAKFCPVDGALLEAAPEPPKPGDPIVGTTLEGKYRIESRLGAGGMGAVYKAHHLLLGRDVAVKVLKSEMLADPRAAERFRREAQAAARLEHPNAVGIYDFGISHDGNAYLVMELLRGTSLRDLLDREGALSLARTNEIFTKIASAIDRAHELGIIHRDLKPDNVMIDERGDGTTGVKVVDFGIAMLQDLNADASRLTGTGMVVGTANYMSPEHCRGKEIDSRSDIYSLGIVLYEMLTGRVPFEAAIPSAVIVAHVSDPPPPLRTFRADIPAAVERVVLEALAKRPDERPPTAGELARRLDAATRAAGGDATVVASSPPMPTVPVSTPWTDPQTRPETAPSSAQSPTVAVSGPTPGYPSAPPSAPHAQYPPSGPMPATTAEPRAKSPALVIGLVVLAFLAIGGAAVAAVFGYMNYNSKPVVTSPVAESPAPRPIEPDRPPITQPQPATPAQPTNESTEPADPGMQPVDPATPEAQPTEPAAARALTEDEQGQVEQFLADWISSSESMDIDWHVRHYADRVDYYRGGMVPRARIRADRLRAYSRYDHIELTIPKIYEATVAGDGTVRLVFDKQWEFVGPNGNSTGKVQQLLLLRPAHGTYEIVAEKDIKVY